MEFKSWLSELLEETKEKNSLEKYANYTLIYTEKELTQWINKIKEAAFFALDTETTHLDPMRATLCGISLALDDNAAYVPFGHDYQDAPAQLDKTYVLSQLKPLLENPEIKKIGHHIKYDMEVLANENIELQGVQFDTLLESYILDSTSNARSLDALALKYLGWRTITFEEIAGKGSKQLPFNQIEIQQAGQYAAEDAVVTLRLHE